jgi:hypothetical protein
MATKRVFWGFCINRFGIGPLHYISSRSDFDFEFAEIFVIENRLPDSPSGESTRMHIDTSVFKPFNQSMVLVHYSPGLFLAIGPLKCWFSRLKCCKNWNRDSIATPWLAKSGSRRLSDSLSRGVSDSPTRRVGESPARVPGLRAVLVSG